MRLIEIFESKKVKLIEARDAFFRYVKEKFPRMPEYVAYELIYKNSKQDPNNVTDVWTRYYGSYNWKLVNNFTVTEDIWDNETLDRIRRNLKPTNTTFAKDQQRFDQQKKMIQQQGISKEPIIVEESREQSGKYTLLEGFHRTVEATRKYPKGYSCPAYIGSPTPTTEKIRARAPKSFWQNLKSKFFEDVTGPGVVSAPFLKDGPLKVAKHFVDRLGERDLDLKTVSRFISKGIKKNKAEIEALPVDTAFVLKSRYGLGVAIVKQETPRGIVYLINTAHPDFSVGPNQEVFLADSKLLDKPTPTIGELAEKYHTSLIAVELQLKKGVKVEMEHTKKHSVAKEIALDHLAEDLYYYEKLAKIEKKTDENFADGKGPGRPGDSGRHGIPKGATMAQLEKASKAKGRKGQLARWQLNMRRGKKKG